MASRTGHGRGRGLGKRIETKPWDEQQRSPAAALADPLAAARDAAGRVVGSDAARALARRPRRSTYLPRKLACDPKFEPHNPRRVEYVRRRRTELCNAFGGVSVGAGAMLVHEAWLWAGAEFAFEQGAETGEADWFKTGATLAAQAKQLASACWELCTLEAGRTPKADPSAAFYAAMAAEVEKTK